ncbi:MAG: hypothetical protein AUJ96_09340 [Armatimonadetes bacterium CG2_30_66_41]|nr:aspartyl protease [Armatimonadota bacterium]OIP06319.1 MAG: hypothetical protein AUJ96_09340 [Armatimonadetes bacterium CG2_30_66_41]NCO89968.1 aspartyl protease [Armatimonadota bacterium]NCP30741.1 aspartyl protease [Armatimonadota bacterium]NCQ29620.1 aspartyl protease [Armatimonadota bacterium]
MGLTVLEIEVGNPADPDNTISVEFLIDSGAVYSVVPKRTLDKLGIKPLAEEEFRLANGTPLKRKKGGAVFRHGDRVGIADVLFGQRGDHNLLGASTLEALGLSLDPLKRELKPLPMLLAATFRWPEGRERWPCSTQGWPWCPSDSIPGRPRS